MEDRGNRFGRKEELRGMFTQQGTHLNECCHKRQFSPHRLLIPSAGEQGEGHLLQRTRDEILCSSSAPELFAATACVCP